MSAPRVRTLPALALAGLVLVAPAAGAAEVALGPSWLRVDGDEVIGGALSATWRQDQRVAFLVEASLQTGDTQGENLRALALMAGPRLSFWAQKRLHPFLAVKAGVVTSRRQVEIFGVAVGPEGVCDGGCPSEFGPTAEGGGGLELRLSQHFALRVPEAQYRVSLLAGEWEHGARVAGSVVVRW